jgi:large subunit ribosomal protein L15
MRMPKRGFNNPFAKEFAEVNLWRIEQAIAAGKLDAGQPIDAEALVKAGVLRRVKDGVKLLGKGELKTKINLTVYAATPSARAAVEKVGGTLTTTKPEAAAEA